MYDEKAWRAEYNRQRRLESKAGRLCSRCVEKDEEGNEVALPWCGPRETRKKLTAWRVAAAGVLRKGGIDNLCMLATCIEIGHDQLRRKDVPLVEERIDELYLSRFKKRVTDPCNGFPIQGDIVCCHCNNYLTNIPCIICTLDKMLAVRYRWRPRRQWADVGEIQETNPLLSRGRT